MDDSPRAERLSEGSIPGHRMSPVTSPKTCVSEGNACKAGVKAPPRCEYTENTREYPFDAPQQRPISSRVVKQSQNRPRSRH